MRASAPFHLLAKPFGARCNLECRYCFYLPKRELLPDAPARMSDATLEHFTRAYIEAQPAGTSEVEFAWQGGEPTLAGLAFFERALELQRRFARPGMVIRNALQTNGTLLDTDWAQFLARHAFLVGVSLDGPPRLHDPLRVDTHGHATHERVLRALALLAEHKVEHNVLTVVHALNAPHPVEVYDFLVGTGVRFLQFIPLVERAPEGGLSARSVPAAQYGKFLVGVLERWLARGHVGEVFVRDFDSTLAALMDLPGRTCVSSQECGRCLAIERTGDVYSCDHFVDPEHALGRVGEHDLAELVDGTFQSGFGRAKSADLPRQCRECEHLRLCWGGCPKDRIARDSFGEPGLNQLCTGYRIFFERALPVLKAMERCLRAGRPAREWRALTENAPRAVDRNSPCPCGSGAKFKRCCGA